MPDFTEKYNTKLSAEDEGAFQAAIAKNPKLARDLYDYDVRGWFKAGGQTSDNGHGSDEFKKPNHPTFSDESIFHGKDGNYGGRWGGTDEAGTFKPGKTNLKHHSLQELQRYFAEVEPDIALVTPKTPSQIMYPSMAPKEDAAPASNVPYVPPGLP